MCRASGQYVGVCGSQGLQLGSKQITESPPPSSIPSPRGNKAFMHLEQYALTYRVNRLHRAQRERKSIPKPGSNSLERSVSSGPETGARNHQEILTHRPHYWLLPHIHQKDD
ncbi:hypothetical protein EYF80_001819 [Liparis tanakae]|uniref:Uncharacterized protein n=1 Tax=Liparis tanakae TaxID=230148 RepID=A0A4Z2JC16_9TELE|nr:hypothetical protein EYF80_001819 [Liparis tanakae]